MLRGKVEYYFAGVTPIYREIELPKCGKRCCNDSRLQKIAFLGFERTPISFLKILRYGAEIWFLEETFQKFLTDLFDILCVALATFLHRYYTNQMHTIATCKFVPFAFCIG